jgi:PAS domain S-box-containing protein
VADTQMPVRRSPTVVAICAGGAAALAAAGLSGWIFHVDRLKQVAPTLPLMTPMTAVSCLAAALSLWLQRIQPIARRARAIALTLAAIGVVAGGSRLLAICAGVDARVDSWLFHAAMGNTRMAFQTAVGLCLLGLALSLLDAGHSRLRPAQALALLAGGWAGVSLLGYLYRARTLYGVATYKPIAVHTAVAFTLLSTGILAARPHRGIMRVVTSPTLGGSLCRRVLPIGIFAPVLLGAVRLIIVRRGWIAPDLGSSLLVMSTIVLFTVVVWTTARVLDRAEASQQAAQARYRAVVEQTAEGIYLVDAQTKQLVESNAAFCRLLGYEPHEADGLTVYDIVDAAPADIDRRFHEVVTGTRRAFGRRVYFRKGGAPIHVQANATAIVVDGRDLLCTVVHDITAELEAERAIAEKNRQLEESVRAEHEALAALRQAQSHLVEQEKLAGLGQMVAGVAHEINNPLSFVANNTAVLQRDLADVNRLLQLYQQGDAVLAAHVPAIAAQIRELSEQIDVAYTMSNSADLLGRSRDGLKRIQQIVRDLRDFARLDEGELQDADLNAGIESTANIIRGVGKKGRVTVDLQLSPLRPYPCYAAKLNQVVMNLLANAIDASQAESTVTVRSRQTDVGGIEIEVEDQGTGMPPQVQAKIFDPFFTTKPPGHGTGLGLSISYGIVKDHGGTIEVSSELGRGTRFTIKLPPRDRR